MNIDEQQTIEHSLHHKDPVSASPPGQASGLRISRHFTQAGTDVFSLFSYERRTSSITNPDGSKVFEMEDIEVPTDWSQLATDILAQKYLRKAGVPQHGPDGKALLNEMGEPILGPERSIKQVVSRLADCWRSWGERHDYFASAEDAQAFHDEIAYMLLAQMAAPNSPQWFNTGLQSAYGITGPAQGHWYVDPHTAKATTSENAYERPQVHACFIQSVRDELVGESGIFDLLLREARIFKYGSGTGSNFSSIRGKGEPLSGGGTSSGLLSFLRVHDRAAGSIRSGGTTRRAAKMVCLDLDHPEIQDFITWKMREESKVADLYAGSRINREHLQRIWEAASKDEERLKQAIASAKLAHVPGSMILRAIQLARQGISLDEHPIMDTDYRGEAFETVSGQNANNSVRIPNTFFEALDAGSSWDLIRRTDGEVHKSIPADTLWGDICHAAWACADPGLQFDTTINEWHTCPADGRINGSNPCSEYMFLDDTACNLASFNLLAFYDEDSHELDLPSYRHAIRLWTIVLEISVLMAQFPSRTIAENSYRYRTLGLGYANIGGLLMSMGIPYDSDRGRAICGALTAILTGDAYATSAELARELGAFEGFARNREDMLRVLRNHRRAAYGETDHEELSVLPTPLSPSHCPADLVSAAKESWDRALSLGEQYGYRNAQVSALAPTGTISLVMDCDTSGIEPDYALVKYKKLAGGGYLKIVNQSVPRALKALGYGEEEIESISAHLLEHDTIEEAPQLQEEHLPVFDCASAAGQKGTRLIAVDGHIGMMAAAQPFISGAISKTINMPEDATLADVDRAYRSAWERMLKGITIYRDGSKLSQPLSSQASSLISETEIGTEPEQAGVSGPDQLRRPTRTRLAKKRHGFVQEATVGGHKVFLRTGEYEDGTLGEIFIDMYKEGASFRSLVNCFAVGISKALQYGVPLEEFVDSFTFTRFEPAGMVHGHKQVKSATSVLDYVFRVLGHEYLGRTDFLHVPPDETTQTTLDGSLPPMKDESATGLGPGEMDAIDRAKAQGFVGEPCGMCGSMRVRRNGTCLCCEDCGTTSGCS